MSEILVAPTEQWDATEAQWNGILTAIAPAIRNRVVDQAALHLRSGNASRDTKSALESALSYLRIPVKGYRHASAAPQGLLAKTILQNLDLGGDHRLAATTVRAWAEYHSGLKDNLYKFLNRVSSVPETQNRDRAAENKIRSVWPVETLPPHWTEFLDTTEGKGYDQEEILLMSVWITRESPRQADIDRAIKDWGKHLTSMLDGFRGIPANSEVWDGPIPEFGQTLLDITAEKLRERTLTGELEDIVRELRTRRREQLQFFEADYRRWTAANLNIDVSVPQAMETASELDELLETYAGYHEQGKTFAEESLRNAQRAELASQVMEAISKMNEALHGPNLAPEDEQEPETVPEQDPAGESGQMQEEEGQQGQMNLDGGIEQLITIEEFEELENENRRLAQELEALQANLTNAQESGEYWREVAENARELPAEDAGEEREPEPVKSVAQAVERATAEFPDELLIALNSQSEVENNPFVRPEEIQQALTWLAQDYRGARTGEHKLNDYNLSVKEACGWTYKASQSNSTMGKHREEYRTRVDGKTHVLKEHIGKGSSKDPRHTIRIAFNYDRKTKKVVVGYIGLHQPNKAT